MRTVVILIIMAVLGLAFVAQKRHEQQKVAAPQKVPVQTSSPRPVSEHDWAKHSLDTTNKVIRQVAQQRKADGTR
jgi:glucose dehydrogenase